MPVLESPVTVSAPQLARGLETSPIHIHVLMRDEKEERKKQATPRQSLFLRKMSCVGWDSNP